MIEKIYYAKNKYKKVGNSITDKIRLKTTGDKKEHFIKISLTHKREISHKYVYA